MFPSKVWRGALIVVFLWMGLSTYAIVGQAFATPANPNASPAAKAVLNYLADLTTRESNRILAGQFGSFGEDEDLTYAQQYQDEVFEASGKYVALTGVDYNAWCFTNPVEEPACTYADYNAWLSDKWRTQRSLIMISWHAQNPWDPTRGAGSWPDWDHAAHPIGQLIDPDSDVHDTWMSLLDAVAEQLAALRDNGVVVLWRPFHEMNGGWFWWNLQAPEDFQAVWQHMFSYLSEEKGLDNLLWVYAPNSSYNAEMTPLVTALYPGDSYVDIVGFDHYMACEEGETGLGIDLNKFEGYDALKSLGKPLGLTELGPVPADPDQPCFWDYKYDFAKLPAAIREAYPEVTFFQSWEWRWRLGEHRNLDALMTDPWIVSGDELPDFSADE